MHTQVAMAGARVSMSDRSPWTCQASCGCLDGVAGAEAGMGCDESWGSLVRVAGAPGTFQTTASVLALGVSWSVHNPINSRILVSYNFLALLGVSPAGFQSLAFWRLNFWARPPGLVCMMQTSCSRYPFILVGHCTRGVRTD